MNDGRPGNPWLHRHAARPDTKVTLVCFPHAGGTPAFFQRWPKSLPTWIDVVSVHYPGRDSRLLEPLIPDMATLVSHISDALCESIRSPFAFFGHSLGAAVAHEVVRRLEAHRLSPMRLYVSGRRAPQFERKTTRYLNSDDKLWNDLFRIGGTPEKLRSDLALRALVLPALRNDYRLSETYQPALASRLQVPITACTGREDKEASVEHVAGWEDVSAAGFRLRVFDGGHFYLIRNGVDLLATMAAELAAAMQAAEEAAPNRQA